MHKTGITGLVIALLLVLLVACGGGEPTAEEATGGDTAAEEATGGDTAAEEATGGDTAAEEATGGDTAAEEATGGEPAPTGDFSSIELFPGASTADDNTILTQMVDAMQNEFTGSDGGENLTAEGYELPEGATFEDVKAHYDPQLTAIGYTAASEMDEVATEMEEQLPGSGIAGWSNESNSSVYTTFVFPDPLDPDTTFLIITYGNSVE